ncbi:MAG: fumarylacetoacetate hydrolase family protein, partial [Emcibacter sp.]|nr:fumarylacetoacetate hydrolase family protein [Emcibacter sp.]
MKLVTYEHNGSGQRAGAIASGGREIVDLLSANMGVGSSSENEWYANIQSMIEGGDEALHTAYDLVKKAPSSARVPYEDVILHAPVQPPIQMRDCLCFEGHLINAFKNARKMRASQSEDPEVAMAEMEQKGILQVPQTFYEQPIYYKANRFSVVGHDRDVLWPKHSQLLDFELEFGCYIGKLALDVPKEKALDFVYGYTIFNDFTARDSQIAEMGGQLGPAKGKDFDTGN